MRGADLINYAKKKTLTYLLSDMRKRQTEKIKLFCLPGDHIGDHVFIDGMYESELLIPLFRTVLSDRENIFKNSTCLDIGANIGNHTVFFAGLFRNVVSFEPNPIFSSVMKASVRLNGFQNVEVHQLGLSDGPQKLPYTMRQDSLGESHFTDEADGDAMILEVDSGDAVVERQGITDVSLIKIDVEGHELRALTGLSKTIRRYTPLIIFESHPEVDYEGSVSVINLLRSLGYKHFYYFQDPLSTEKNMIRKRLRRLSSGFHSKLIEFNEIDREPHLMIVGSSQPLA